MKLCFMQIDTKIKYNLRSNPLTDHWLVMDSIKLITIDYSIIK